MADLGFGQPFSEKPAKIAGFVWQKRNKTPVFSGFYNFQLLPP